MHNEIGTFSQFFKLKKSYIDNSIFRLHYRTTTCILLVASHLLMATQFIGDPIHCMVDGIPEDTMNTYCWIQGTFTIPSQLGKKVGVEIPHPGIAPLRVNKNGDEIRHAWYQWAPIALLFQATLFYIPHYLWKYFEGGKLNLIIQGLNHPTLADQVTIKDRSTLIVNFFIRRLKTHNFYVLKFSFCEVLNLVNVVIQIFLTDLFLGGQFTSYGIDVLSIIDQPLENRSDPLNYIFPKVTKCTFKLYGPSGTVEKKDGICVLLQNSLNEKIYILLWFWFVFLTIWTGIQVLYRLISVVFHCSRIWLLSNRCCVNNRSEVSTVVKKCNYGDWFLLMQLSEHIQPVVFHDFMMNLSFKIDRTGVETQQTTNPQIICQL